MRVLSLFDGMSCGMLAFDKANINIDSYIAFETDKFAIKTSSHNFPTIEHCGDVFDSDFTEFVGFEWLIGGSPCTYWSTCKKDGRETIASGTGWNLFMQYVKALHVVKPLFFIYENNKSMAQNVRDSISSTFGFEPICIDSALVSAQQRKRLYWVGKRNDDGTYSKVNVEEPENKHLLLQQIIGTTNAVAVNTTVDGKAQCLRATYYKDGIRNMIANNVDRRTCVAEKVFDITECNENIYTVKDSVVTVKGVQYPISLSDGNYVFRKLSVTECMRLQTVPVWYEFPVSDTQAYKMLGNGWTVDVIEHIINTCMRTLAEDVT